MSEPEKQGKHWKTIAAVFLVTSFFGLVYVFSGIPAAVVFLALAFLFSWHYAKKMPLSAMG